MAVDLSKLEETRIDTVEILQNCMIQIMANETHILLCFSIPGQHRMVQVPIDRLAFHSLLGDLNRAAERGINNPDLNGHDEPETA